MLGTLAGLGAPDLHAQEWRVDLLGGRDHLQQGPTSSGSSSFMIGLRAVGSEAWAGAFVGVPVETEQAPWGAALGSARLWADEGDVRLGADLSGQLFLQGDRSGRDGEGGLGRLPRDNPLGQRLPTRHEDGPVRGWGASGEGMAVLQLRRRPLTVELRGGAAHYRHAFDDESIERTLPQLHLKGQLTPQPALLVQGEARRYWADEGALARLDATALRVLGPATAWLSAGRWIEGPVEGTPWAAGASLDVYGRATVVASVRREPYEPLYLTPDRTTWSAGLSVRFGGPPRVRAPVPERYEAGVATVTLSTSDASGAPLIAGDFNDWQPAPMVREGDRWVFRVRIEPGVYNYAFVTEGGRWFVPETVPGRKPDGFGGYVAVLVVAEA
jgi:hypothetical protein